MHSPILGVCVLKVKLCSRDPSPPSLDYVRGGGGIFKDMAVHDLDMSRYFAGAEPVSVLATGSCEINQEIADLPGSEIFDTASCLVKFSNDTTAIIDVCRQSSYGYDQRAEVLETKGMIQTDNVYPNTARVFTSGMLLSLQDRDYTLRHAPLPTKPSRLFSFTSFRRFYGECRYALRLLPLTLQPGLHL